MVLRSGLPVARGHAGRLVLHVRRSKLDLLLFNARGNTFCSGVQYGLPGILRVLRAGCALGDTCIGCSLFCSLGDGFATCGNDYAVAGTLISVSIGVRSDNVDKVGALHPRAEAWVPRFLLMHCERV